MRQLNTWSPFFWQSSTLRSSAQRAFQHRTPAYRGCSGTAHCVPVEQYTIHASPAHSSERTARCSSRTAPNCTAHAGSQDLAAVFAGVLLVDEARHIVARAHVLERLEQRGAIDFERFGCALGLPREAARKRG
eukprot:3430588-Rhodomonas_salina.1